MRLLAAHVQRVGEPQDRLCKHMVKPRDARVCFDAFLGEHYRFFVPVELEGGLDESDKDCQSELVNSYQFGAILSQLVLIVLAVVFDQVARDLVDLERLLKLLVLVERVPLRLEMLSVAQLVIEVVC